jgi:hypothetical protein
MSISVNKQTFQPVKAGALTPQPFHDKLKSVQNMIQSRYHFNPLDERGFESVLSSESLLENVGQSITELVGDEGAKSLYSQVYRNTMGEIRNPFAAMSEEGADALAPNANYNQFARLNPWSILGYIARSKCLELYLTIESDTPTVTYEYNLSYVVKGTDTTKYFLPNAIRDGTIGGIYDLPELKIDIDSISLYDHLAKKATGPAGEEEGWITLPAHGNVLREAGPEFEESKFAVERNLSISEVYWKVPDPLDPNNKTVEGHTTVNNDRGFISGEISKRSFSTPLQITFADSQGGTHSFQCNIMGVIDLDTGVYDVAATGPITHIKFWARATNMANELGTVRTGNTKFVENFDVNGRVYGNVPISPQQTDDFNAAGEGVTFVAYSVDKLTESFAGVRDIDMETRLDRSFTDGPDSHRLWPKIGGSAQSLNFPLAARGAGGGDPFTWATIGLKNTLNFMFANAETDTYFEDHIVRNWFILGHETDVFRIPDISFTNFAGDTDQPAGAASANFKYGFALDAAAGYADNFGRRVKVFGSKYRRHQGKPMRAVLKSNNIAQPTQVYLPYSFRVFSSISPEHRNLPSLSVAARDYVGALSTCQARIQLIGNNVGLYEQLSRNSAGLV